ncbi:MAG: hypothetical protein HQL02_14485 [Nitrospirae bacterium]|nr:hypothetical protein [Nitrospirota bacterium]
MPCRRSLRQSGDTKPDGVPLVDSCGAAVILHPGAIALFIGEALVIALSLYASSLGIGLLRHWDINSSSEGQLRLERRTYLISTLMSYVMLYEVLSTFLYIYTLDAIHLVFVGAMCATGSLNANDVGWYVLYLKIVLFFLSASWIAINHLDNRAEDYPLIRAKYRLLLLITPVIVLDGVLLMRYFIGLRPDIITSCCGSLFSDEGKKVAGDISALPIKTMMKVFYASAAFLLSLIALAITLKSAVFRYLTAVGSFIFFFIAVLSIVSFVSIYFYELPTHHCPFDILQQAYGYVGYPLYGSLFAGVFFGVISGVAQSFKRIPSLTTTVEAAQRVWLVLAAIGISVFVAICTWPIVFSSFRVDM